MKPRAIGLMVTVLVCFQACPTLAQLACGPYSLLLHTGPESYGGCNAHYRDDEDLSCDVINVDGGDCGTFTIYYLWIRISGVPAYDPGD